MATAHKIRDLIAPSGVRVEGLGVREAPRAYLREATLRVVRNPGTATLARDVKSSES